MNTTLSPAAIVIIGAGPAGRAAASLLPQARVIARPEATVWHAEPGRLWIEDAAGVHALPFAQLLLCADEPLLLAALGCQLAGGRPAVSPTGATSVAGIFAAGRILGAATPDEAARQGRIAAQALAGLPSEGSIAASPQEADPAAAERLDPLDLALVLDGQPEPARNRAALAQMAARGPSLGGLIAPARPVGLAALAAIAPAAIATQATQQDTGRLGTTGAVGKRDAGSTARFDVIVVGGGLHGLSAALHIARRGRRVLVLEKDRVAAHASSFSAGGVRTLGRHPAEVPLAVESLALWHHIADLVGDDCGFQEVGHVKVAENAAEMQILAQRAATMRAAGWEHEEVVDAAELRRLLPAVAPHAVGGLVARRNGFARPYRTTLAFRRAAEAAGATVREGAAVTDVTRKDGQWRLRCADGTTHAAPVLVNAAGAWGARLARAAGQDIPMGFSALMMIYTSALPPFVRPVVGLTTRPLSFKQAESGHVMIGGGHRGVADLATGGVALDVPRLAFSVRTALDIFPILANARVIHTWAGIEGMLPDEIPVVGLSRVQPGLVHAFGFCGHGFELGPVMGGIVAQLALDGGTNWPIAAFAPDRFTQETSAQGEALLQPAG